MPSDNLNMANEIFADLPSDNVASAANFELSNFFDFIQNIYFLFLIIFIVISLLLYAALQYLKILLKKHLKIEEKFYKSQKRSELAEILLAENSRESSGETKESNSELLSHLKSLEKYLDSDRYEDWRAAIFEADLLLKKLLLKRGVPNGTLGQMLKSLQAKDFEYLEEAWEAHKFRNLLAHSFMEDKRPKGEFVKVFKLYERIFKNLDIKK